MTTTETPRPGVRFDPRPNKYTLPPYHRTPQDAEEVYWVDWALTIASRFHLEGEVWEQYWNRRDAGLPPSQAAQHALYEWDL